MPSAIPALELPPEKQRLIFAPFSQADGTTARKYGGTGLGLTISSRLVAMLGGSIWLESRPGEGSCFHFKIPLQRTQPAAADGAENPSAPDEADRSCRRFRAPLADAHMQRAHESDPRTLGQTSGDLRNLRILLAEDNLVNQKLACRLMEKRGHSVVVAGNGREALQAMERQSFDLLITDVSMPEMDGLEMAAALRALERATGTHLPIIAMTAHTMQGDRERCLAAGMDAYVAKPLRAKELFATIQALVPQSHSS